MAGAGITQSICLPLLSVYQLSSNGTVQVSAGTRRGPGLPADCGYSRKASLSLISYSPRKPLFRGSCDARWCGLLPVPAPVPSMRSSHR